MMPIMTWMRWGKESWLDGKEEEDLESDCCGADRRLIRRGEGREGVWK